MDKKYSVFVALSVFFIATFCEPRMSSADVAVGYHDWDPAPSPGWSSSNGWSQVSVIGSGGNTGPFLGITFTNTPLASDPSTWQDLIYTPATSLFAGAYSVSNWFAFDFFASNTLPNDLQVRWGSSTNSRVWGNDISGPTTTGVWETLRSSGLGNWEDWDLEPFGDADLFAADLSTIGWVGLYIDRNTAIEQMYGVDNFSLMVPEPAELIMLAAALAAVWMAYRRKEQRA